ncbi:MULTISPECIES: hypothetical protein [unclassified Corallococcus]|uniref:hypothetical protein n=1 Tax=unclassified Corallococcus TaxID=2685029 RepID=UPI001A904BCD|nr:MULTISPECIES: hypothetical protein [unclassified Corallococcus]MBN9682743.1 hypothetical protein [Corallococcus sp. NCSPR001]WAS85716.1 hypothetical protein O0N60_01795 [Corallococcus sp. NCRR]
MLRPLFRTALPWLACAWSITACDSVPKPEGECRGPYGDRSVVWPIHNNAVMSAYFIQDGDQGTQLHLEYSPDGAPELTHFGVNVLIAGEPTVTAGTWTAKLRREGDALVPEDPSRLLEWYAFLGPGHPGYPSVTGVPVEGTLTLERLVHGDGQAQGRFVYHYEDGGELTCTFNITDRYYTDDGDWLDGVGDGDDDDDD